MFLDFSSKLAYILLVILIFLNPEIERKIGIELGCLPNCFTCLIRASRAGMTINESDDSDCIILSCNEEIYMTPEPIEITIETTQTLDTMLHQVLNQALVAIDADAGSLMLVDNKQGILQIKARLGKPQPRRKIERVFKIDDKSIAGGVVQNKQSYLCSDVDNDTFFVPSRSGRNFFSLLSVPIVFKDKVLAVINADATERNYFTEAHKERLEYFAKQVAVPIAERVSILDAIAEVGFELSQLPKEGGIALVLEKIARAAVKSLGADVVTLYQYIQDKDEFPVAGTGPTIAGSIGDKSPMQRKVYKGDVPWTVVHERKSGFYPDVHKQDFLTREVERPGDAPRPRFIEREGIKSMAALLLPFRAAELKEEEVVGVMFVNYHTRHEFNIDEIAALASFADYAAVAILNARHQEQRRAEQMRMVESISANFAHRMSNLAGTSRVAAQILRERINPSDETSRRQLERIEQEAKVLLELAERLAQPFRGTGKIFELTPIDINGIIEEELHQVSLPRIIISRDLIKNLPEVESVEFQLRQVVHDIINNAIEAMKDQDPGKLEIRTRLNRKTNQVEVEVADSGPGIPEDLRSRLFAPGVTTKKEKLGIGLWWCQTFMRATGGDVVLKDTRIGEGTTFVIKIPCIKQRDSASTDDLLAIKNELDILIVDDEQRWRDQLVDVIANELYSVHTAKNYDEASNALLSNYFKLAIVDIRLVDADPNNEDGLRLLADIDKANLKTKVIIVTGFETQQTEEQKRRANQSPRLLDFVRKGELNVAKFRRLICDTVGEKNPDSEAA